MENVQEERDAIPDRDASLRQSDWWVHWMMQSCKIAYMRVPRRVQAYLWISGKGVAGGRMP